MFLYSLCILNCGVITNGHTKLWSKKAMLESQASGWVGVIMVDIFDGCFS